MQIPSFLVHSKTNYFVVFDMSGRIILANDLLQQTVPGFANGANGSMVVEMVSPEAQWQFMQAIQQCFPGATTLSFTQQFRLQTHSAQSSQLTQWEFTFVPDNDIIGTHIVGVGHMIPCTYTETELSDSLINGLPCVFFIQDENNRYLKWNDRFETVSGYTGEEIKLLNSLVFFDKKDHDRVLTAINTVLQTGYGSVEAEVITKYKTVIPYFFSARSITYNGKRCIIGTGIDHSQYVAAQEQSRVSNEKYHSLFDQASDFIHITDYKGNFLDANTSMLEMFGYTKEDLLTMNISSLIDAEQLKQKPIAFDVLAAGKHVFSQRKMVRKDGSIINVEANVRKFGNGMIMAIARDITARKVIEADLERSEKNLQHVLSSSADNFYMIDTDYCVTLINDTAQKNLYRGWGKHVTLGANILELIPTDTDEQIKESFDKALSGKHVKYELHVRFDKSLAWVQVNCMPVIDDDGAVTGVYIVTKNITEQKRSELEKEEVLYKLSERVQELTKSEANLDTIFNSTDSVYVLMDTRFQIISYNKPALVFAAKELKHTIRISDGFLDYFPHERQATLLGQLKRALAGTYVNYEATYPQPDGTTNWYDVRIFAISGANGETFGIMMAVLDITDKKLLEQEILDQKVQEQKKITRAMIKAQEKERNHIGRELHDNVNQILAGTKIYLQSAARKDEKVKELIKYPLELIESSINEIRALSGRQVTPLKNIDLEELIHLLLESMGHSGDVKTEFTYNLVGAVIDDDLKLNIYRIIQEQVNNINKHAHATRVGIYLDTDKETHTINVRIRDNGKGFETGKKRKGIGISNMINRIESFNGEVMIESSPGNGCYLQIHIPYCGN